MFNLPKIRNNTDICKFIAKKVSFTRLVIGNGLCFMANYAIFATKIEK